MSRAVASQFFFPPFLLLLSPPIHYKSLPLSLLPAIRYSIQALYCVLLIHWDDLCLLSEETVPVRPFCLQNGIYSPVAAAQRSSETCPMRSDLLTFFCAYLWNPPLWSCWDAYAMKSVEVLLLQANTQRQPHYNFFSLHCTNNSFNRSHWF